MTTSGVRSQECSICLQALINPVKLPCGHSFCFLCVKGVANVSLTCALCRKAFPRELIDKPNVLAVDLTDDDAFSSSNPGNRHVWYYEGRNGWWMYDQRTNDEIDQAFRRGERRIELLVVGQLYVIDFENMLQYRLNDTQRRRRIKYDLLSAPKKGVAGLKLDRQRSTPYDRSISDGSIVPSLASSVPSIIANSSTSDVTRSRSDADGGEPAVISPPVPSDNHTTANVRQPADGFGNPTRTQRDEQRLISWSDDEEDDEDALPPISRTRPVLVGVEDVDLSLANLALNSAN